MVFETALNFGSPRGATGELVALDCTAGGELTSAAVYKLSFHVSSREDRAYPRIVPRSQICTKAIHKLVDNPRLLCHVYAIP